MEGKGKIRVIRLKREMIKKGCTRRGVKMVKEMEGKKVKKERKRTYRKQKGIVNGKVLGKRPTCFFFSLCSFNSFNFCIFVEVPRLASTSFTR